MCQKLRVTVSDMTALSKALEILNLNYQVVSDSEADIFDEITISDLTETAKEYGCRILKVREQDESLESFYLSPMTFGHPLPPSAAIWS